MEHALRLTREGNKTIVEFDFDAGVSVEEVIAFLQLEEPTLAAQLQHALDTLRSASSPGLSNQAIWEWMRRYEDGGKGR